MKVDAQTHQNCRKLEPDLWFTDSQYPSFIASSPKEFNLPLKSKNFPKVQETLDPIMNSKDQEFLLRFSHFSESEWNCVDCNFKDEDKKVMLEHIKSKHEKVITTYDCSECLYKTKSKIVLYNHQKSHKKSKTIESPITTLTETTNICESQFQNNDFVKEESDKISESPKMKSNENKNLESLLKTESQLRSHGNSPTLAAEKSDGTKKINLPSNLLPSPAKSVLYMFRCKFCKTVFKFRSELHKHLREFHSLSFKDKRRYSCSYCNFCCYKETEIQLHLKVKHRKGLDSKNAAMKSVLKRAQIQMFTCKICGAQFSNQKLYNTHLREDEGFKYKCLHCESYFKTKSTFNEHTEECSEHILEKEVDSNINLLCSSLLDVLDS